VPNITTTNIDNGSVVLAGDAWADGVLQNVEVTEQTYAAGTMLARSASSGNLLPYAPAAVADTIVDVTVDVADIPANTAPDTAVTVPGALVGDVVTIEPLGTWPVGLAIPQGRVLVDGTVQMRTSNVTAGAINPGSQLFRFSLEHDVEPPKCVLTYPVTVAASSSAAVRVLTAGQVNQNRLRIHNGTTINAAHRDALRDYGIVPVDVNQLAKIDNPQ
jgi:hypothetical protein